MQPEYISHVIADVSNIETPESIYQLKILVGEEYELKISEQVEMLKDVDLSKPNKIFYVRSIDELRDLMREAPKYNFVIDSYVVYSFHQEASMDVYISSIGGRSISPSNVKDYLVNSLINSKDEGVLSSLVEKFSGYESHYDGEKDTYLLSDNLHNYARKQRIDDEEIINSVFSTQNETDLSNQDIIKMMRDKNEIPAGLKVRDEFIALNPIEIITHSSGLIETGEDAIAEKRRSKSYS